MSTSTSTFPFFFSSTFSRPRSSPLDGRRDLRGLEASVFSASQLRFEGSEALRQRFRRDGGEGEGEGERGGSTTTTAGAEVEENKSLSTFSSFSSSSSIPRARAFPPSLQRLCASLSPWDVKVRCICPPSRSTAALSERHGGENGFPRNGRASFVDHRMRRRRNGRFWSCRYSTQSPREPLLLAFFSLDGLR